MELIEGQRIDRHCREAALPLDVRLRLFLDVLDAVEFAHARLLIHRDIKPGNVLVDADGRPKLLDFGISAFSRGATGASAWSPGFASPEQLALGEVGTASDQYQLGRLLDTMLLAAEPASPAEQTPASPRSSQWLPMPRVRQRELVAVVARTLGETPAQRYGSVAELRQEVMRLLERRPVVAREGGPLYAAACLLRRRPLAAPSAIAAIAAFATLTAGFNIQLARQRDLAVLEAEKARAVTEFLVDDILTAADPFAVQSSDLSVREALDRARAALANRFADKPATEAEVRTLLGRTYLNIGEIAAAEAQLERAEAILATPGAGINPELARVLLLKADIVRYRADFQGMAATLESLRPGFARAFGDDGEWTLWAGVLLHEAYYLGGRVPDAVDVAESLQPLLLGALGLQHPATQRFFNGLGHRQVVQGAGAEAAETFRLLAAAIESQLGEGHARALQAREGLGRALRLAQRLEEAEDILRNVLARREATFGRAHRETLDALNELAIVRSNQGDAEEAIALWRESLDIKLALLGEEHQSTLTTRYNLARQSQLAGDFAAAREEFRALLAVEERTRGRDAWDTVVTLISLAEVTLELGEHADGLLLIEDATARGRGSLAGRPELAVAYSVRGEALASVGRVEEARAALEESLAMFAATVGLEHPRARQAVARRQALEALSTPVP